MTRVKTQDTEKYKEWDAECDALLKSRPLINKVPTAWRISKWRQMYRNGFTPQQAVDLCVLTNRKKYMNGLR